MEEKLEGKTWEIRHGHRSHCVWHRSQTDPTRCGLPDHGPGSLVKDPGSKRQDAHTQLVWVANTSRKRDTAL